MKRTNLVLDEELLEEAKRVTGSRTYSATVDRALRELVRKVNIRQILDLQGSGLWEGDLAEMRRDASYSMVADRPWSASHDRPADQGGSTEEAFDGMVADRPWRGAQPALTSAAGEEPPNGLKRRPAKGGKRRGPR
jgi:Arc/MetJ family transcription regulator